MPVIHWDLSMVATVGGLALGALLIMGVVAWGIFEQNRRLAQTRERERTRREIAAYVAEGSITAEDAARLLAESPADLRSARMR